MKIKLCSYCKKELLISSFCKNKHSADGLNWFCKKCRSNKHFENKKHNNKISREYYYSHKLDRLKKAKLWKETHKEQVQLYNKKYKQENYEKLKPKHNFNNKLRKIRIKKLGGFHTLDQWNVIKYNYNYTCPCCLKSEPEIKLTEDHVIAGKIWNEYIKNYPEITYKYNDIENIQPLCNRCNSSKLIKVIRYLEPRFVNIEVLQNQIRY